MKATCPECGQRFEDPLLFWAREAMKPHRAETHEPTVQERDHAVGDPVAKRVIETWMAANAAQWIEALDRRTQSTVQEHDHQDGSTP